jgi:hypothetical protein
VHVSPVSGSSTIDTTPTLTATFSDPDAPNTGLLQFEVCTVAMAAGQSCAAALGSVLSTGSTAGGIVIGGSGAWTSGVLTAGTRYWHARGTDNWGVTGPWSASSTLVIGVPSMTVTVSLPSETIAPAVLAPFADGSAATTVTISTNNATGFTLNATDASDTTGMAQGVVDTVPDWTGTAATPTTWVAGTGGYFGLTVTAATGGKDTARWGTGVVATDYANNKYVGLRTTSTMLHQTSTYSAAATTVTTGYRVDFSGAELPGTYTTTVTYTGVANP